MSIFGAGYFWDSGIQLKVGALSFSKFCPFIAISRDHSQESNCIELDAAGTGEPVINYVVTKQDEENLLHGLVSSRIMAVLMPFKMSDAIVIFVVSFCRFSSVDSSELRELQW